MLFYHFTLLYLMTSPLVAPPDLPNKLPYFYGIEDTVDAEKRMHKKRARISAGPY